MSDPVNHEIDLLESASADVAAAKAAYLDQMGYGVLSVEKADTLIARLRAAEARAEAVEAERDRLAKRVVGYDRERDFRATPVYEKMVGGSDVCATCECHCITLGEYDEEIAALRARVPTEDEIEALEVAVEELDALETRELAACGYSDAGPWLSALRALVARNTPKEKTDGE